MKNILVSIATSLAACVAFHYPEVLWLYLYLGIGFLISLAAKKANRNDYFTFNFFWPIGFIILLDERQFVKVMLRIIPGHTISIKKDEE